MLNWIELERAVRVLSQEATGCRIQAAVQPERQRVVLELYGGPEGARGRRALVLSCHPATARVGLADRPQKSGGSAPPAFTQYLRAHLVGGRVEGVHQVDGDRQLAHDVRAEDGDYRLLLSIFGRRSNLYVLDGEGRVVAAVRPLAETRSELAFGEPWRSPQSPPRRQGDDRFADVPDEEFLAAVERRYAAEEAEGEQSELARRVGQAIRKEARNLDRKLEKLERELADAEAATVCERHGELLKSVLSDVARGDTSVVVRDWDSGEDVRIALDATLTPAENMERLFKRYRKALRTLTKGGGQLEGVRASRADVAALERDLEQAGEGADALEALAARPEVARLLGRFAPGPAPRQRARPEPFKVGGREVPAKFVPRRYRTAGDLEIWVGRSDAANDHLTTRLARGKDLFFHLDGAPGSHVILRTEGRDDPPSDAVLDACELAVHYSKQKKASRADVHVVPIKNVKKPKGAKPGLVMVHGGKSIHLRRSEARLERVLAAKIED
ncbi:MAG: NFACT RNA binding domain-containing protein [Myxococcota bacterium]